MRVLSTIANPRPISFCQAMLPQFSRDVAEAGHTSEVVDLYAIDFDPDLRRDVFASFVHESTRPLFSASAGRK